MEESKKKRGRPKKEDGKNVDVHFMLTEKENNELNEFAMLSRMNKSDLLREGLHMKIQELRSKFNLPGVNYDDYDFYDCDSDDEIENNEFN